MAGLRPPARSTCATMQVRGGGRATSSPATIDASPRVLALHPTPSRASRPQLRTRQPAGLLAGFYRTTASSPDALCHSPVRKRSSVPPRRRPGAASEPSAPAVAPQPPARWRRLSACTYASRNPPSGEGSLRWGARRLRGAGARWTREGGHRTPSSPAATANAACRGLPHRNPTRNHC